METSLLPSNWYSLIVIVFMRFPSSIVDLHSPKLYRKQKHGDICVNGGWASIQYWLPVFKQGLRWFGISIY